MQNFNHSIPTQQPQYSSEMICGGYWQNGFPPTFVQPSTSYASVLSTAASPLPLTAQNQWPNTPRLQNESSLVNGQINNLPQQQIIQQIRDLDMISRYINFLLKNFFSYRPPASPTARQLAAELDELRRNEFQQLSNNMYTTNSLPRTMFLKVKLFKLLKK